VSFDKTRRGTFALEAGRRSGRIFLPTMSTDATPLEYVALPEQRRFDQLCDRVRSSLTAARLTSEDILATLAEARNRVYTRRYGKKPSENISRRRRSSSPTHSQRTRMSGAPGTLKPSEVREVLRSSKVKSSLGLLTLQGNNRSNFN